MTEPAWRLLVLLLAALAFSGGFAAGVEAMRAADVTLAKRVVGITALSMAMVAIGFGYGWLL